MKASAWLLPAVGLAGLAGLGFVLVGLIRPGQPQVLEFAGGSGKAWLAEAKRKVQSLRQQRDELLAREAGWKVFQGTEGEHRVFVSAQLVYLPENPEPVQPLDRRMRTDDGLEIGWKMKYGFDPADPTIAQQDPDGDGFTNLEEFAAGTDPLRLEDSPAKESKLKSRSGEPVPMTVSFAEKSGGLVTLRFQVGPKRGEFRGRPGDSFWVMAGPGRVEVYGEEGKVQSAQAKAKEAGQSTHALPLQLAAYEEKLEVIKDATAGGVEMEVDNSFVVLERKDAAAASVRLTLSLPSRPKTVSWDVGDILFFAPGVSGGELGPFRIGEIFSFGGKEFAVIGREGKKIQLRHRSEAGKEPFWVPAEGGPAVPAGSP